MTTFTYQPLKPWHECRLVRLDTAPASPPTADPPAKGRNKHSLPLQLDIQTFPLDDLPPYAALSYVWGPEAEAETEAPRVLVGGKPMTIRENLHLALLEISRHQSRGDRPDMPPRQWLWIDSICINQADAAEKTWHVQMIGTTFKSAEQTLIWLGPREERPGVHDSDAVMDFAARVGPAASEADVLQLWGTTNEEFEERMRRHVESSGDPTHSSSGGELPSKEDAVRESPEAGDPAAAFLVSLLADPALRQTSSEEVRHGRAVTVADPVPLVHSIKLLMQRPIWNRCWVIQELGTAAKGTVLCGTRAAPLDHFDAALTAVVHAKASKALARLPSHARFAPFLGTAFYENVPGFRVRRGRRLRLPCPDGTGGFTGGDPAIPTTPTSTSPPSRYPTLASLLMRHGLAPQGGGAHYAATDPRDVIFALLGVVRDGKALGVVPDYGTSTAEVFTAATRGMLASAAGEPVKTRVCVEWAPGTNGDDGRCPVVAGLPSWVPNWHAVGARGLSGNTIEYNKPGWFDASGGLDELSGHDPSSPDKARGTSPLVLHRHGILIDFVDRVMQVPSMTDSRGVKSGIPFPLAKENWLRRIRDFAKLPVSSADAGPDESRIWRSVTIGAYPYMGKASDGNRTHAGRPGLRKSGSLDGGAGATGVKKEGEGEGEEEEERNTRGETDADEVGALFQRAIRDEKIAAATDLSESQARYLRERWDPFLGEQRTAAPKDDLQAVADEYCRCLPSFLTFTLMKRTLFRTANDVVGLGREGVQAGDAVVVLRGSTAPLILRRKDGGDGDGAGTGDADTARWELIGDAYVDGFMFGEAVEDSGDGIRDFYIA